MSSRRRIEEPIVYVNNLYNIMVCLVAYYTVLSVFTVQKNTFLCQRQLK